MFSMEWLAAGMYYLAGIGLAGFVVVFAVHEALRQRRSKQWHPAMAALSKAEIAESTVMVDRRKETRYTVVLVYDYTFGGNRYTTDQSSTLSYDAFGSRELAQAEVDKHPLGEQKTVFVDPVNPADSRFTQTLSSVPYIIAVVGVGTMIVLSYHLSQAIK